MSWRLRIVGLAGAKEMIGVRRPGAGCSRCFQNNSIFLKSRWRRRSLLSSSAVSDAETRGSGVGVLPPTAQLLWEMSAAIFLSHKIAPPYVPNALLKVTV